MRHDTSSQVSSSPVLTDHDHEREFRDDILAGLTASPKRISSMYLYDERGSKLFDAICDLDEYYPTRTELGIMRRRVDEMADRIGADCLLVEYGSGSSLKTRFLLEHLVQPAGYVPIDISREHLARAAESLAEQFPALEVLPVCADFNQPIALPEPSRPASHNVIYFPGSTIGNLTPVVAERFLMRTAAVVGPEGGLLIGVDLKKDLDILVAAYNDREGVTAQFNLNLLRRINRELDADFDLDAFEHEAIFNEAEGRIEMHLVSQCDQVVEMAGEVIEFTEGETIHTENSYKYSLDEFEELAAKAGWSVEQVWTDHKQLFSVQYLEVGE